MYKLTIFLFALAAAPRLHCEAKIFSRCGLVRELRWQRFPESEMRDWVCLMSPQRRNDTVGPNWGLFQINEKYCSTTTTPGKLCNVTCAELIPNFTPKDTNCAKLIKSQDGFAAWATWLRFCDGKPLPDITAC